MPFSLKQKASFPPLEAPFQPLLSSWSSLPLLQLDHCFFIQLPKTHLFLLHNQISCDKGNISIPYPSSLCNFQPSVLLSDPEHQKVSDGQATPSPTPAHHRHGQLLTQPAHPWMAEHPAASHWRSWCPTRWDSAPDTMGEGWS